MGVPAGYYTKFAQSLSQRNGWFVLVLESRGHGTSSWRPSRSRDWGYWTIVNNEISYAVDFVAKEYSGHPIVLMGHSVGGTLFSLYLAKLIRNNDVARLASINALVMITSGSVYHKHFSASWLMLLLTILFRVLCSILGYYPGKWFGFGGTEAKSFILDWCYEVWNGKWEPSGCPIPDISKYLKQCNCPVVSLSIDKDSFVGHSAAARALQLFPEAQTTHLKLDRKDFETIKALSNQHVHFKWARDVVFEPLIEDWIRDKL